MILDGAMLTDSHGEVLMPGNQYRIASPGQSGGGWQSDPHQLSHGTLFALAFVVQHEDTSIGSPCS